MSDGDAVLAPTPIVRMTSEQLEYLATRLQGRKWRLSSLRSNEQLISVTAPANGVIVGINETRKALVFCCTRGGPFFVTSQPGGITDTGVLVFGTTQGPITLSIEEWGWQVTRAWYYTYQTAAAASLWVAEIFGPPSIRDL